MTFRRRRLFAEATRGRSGPFGGTKSDTPLSSPSVLDFLVAVSAGVAGIFFFFFFLTQDPLELLIFPGLLALVITIYLVASSIYPRQTHERRLLTIASLIFIGMAFIVSSWSVVTAGSVDWLNFYRNNTLIAQETGINLIEGDNISIVALRDAADDKVDYTISATSTAASSTGHTILDEGVALDNRDNLGFVGAGVTCTNPTSTTTECNVPGGGAATFTVEVDDVLVSASTTVLDFRTDFVVNEAPAGEVNISLNPPLSNLLVVTSTLGDLSGVTLGATSSAQILVMDTQWENVSVSGDATIAASGTLTVGTSTRLRADPTDCGANTFAVSIDPEADLTCTAVDISDDTNLAVSGTLLDLTGDTLSVNEGTLTDNNLCDFESTGSQIECVTNTKAELEGIITDVANFAEADGDIFTGVHNFGGATSLELPTCASIPNVNGEICTRTATSTSELIWYQDEIHILSATTTKGFLLWGATSTDDLIMVWIDGGNAVVTKVCALAEGGANWVGSIQQYDLNGDSPTSLMSGDFTLTPGTRSCTGESGEPTVNSVTIADQNGFGPQTTSVSGTNASLLVQISFKWIL